MLKLKTRQQFLIGTLEVQLIQLRPEKLHRDNQCLVLQVYMPLLMVANYVRKQHHIKQESCKEDGKAYRNSIFYGDSLQCVSNMDCVLYKAVCLIDTSAFCRRCRSILRVRFSKFTKSNSLIANIRHYHSILTLT